MTDAKLGQAIENLMVARNPRRMQVAQAALLPGYYLRAASYLYDLSGTVIIGTGFPVVDTFETDGPVGAIALYDCLQALELAMLAANKAICRAGEADCALEGMGTTATVLVVVADEVLLAHVGDSRLYRCSNGQCEQLTEDHTLVEQMLRDGMISAEDARHHPMRNMLMRSLGTPTGLRVATRRCPPASVGDVFVLCSDGLHESFEATEIAAIVASMEPAAASRRLVELACERDGSDNVSVVVVGIAPAAAADQAAS